MVKQQFTTWSPDHCTCEIIFTWDSDASPDTRVHTVHDVTRKCPNHQNTTDITDHYNVVLGENNRKNFAIDHIIQNTPLALVDVAPDGTKTIKTITNPDGSKTPTWSVFFSHQGVSPNRTLTLTISGITLTQTQLTNLQSKLDTRFGAGKVTVVNV